jgi:hypothetical protein
MSRIERHPSPDDTHDAVSVGLSRYGFGWFRPSSCALSWAVVRLAAGLPAKTFRPDGLARCFPSAYNGPSSFLVDCRPRRLMRSRT